MSYVFGADGNPIQKMVDELHQELTSEERELTVAVLGTSMESYQDSILNLYPVRQAVYEMHNEKVRTNHAVSRMSRNFDMKITGKSQAISTALSAILLKAHESEAGNEFDEPADLLIEAELSFETVLMSPEVRDVLHELDHSQSLKLLVQVESLRDRLVHSAVALAASRAAKRAANTAGDIIMYEDMVMVSLEGLMKAVAKFNPLQFDTPADAAQAFTTFITLTINGALANYESDNSRTVKIPRTTLDRFAPLKSAIEELGESAPLSDLAAYATRALFHRRGGEEMLSRDAAYTEEEVFELIKDTQDFVSLNVEVETVSDDPSDALSVSDQLVDDRPLPDEQADLNLQRGRMEVLIDKHIRGAEDALLMKLRYCLDSTILTCGEVSEIMLERGGKDVAKTYINKVDTELQDKLSRDPSARQVLEVFDGR